MIHDHHHAAVLDRTDIYTDHVDMVKRPFKRVNNNQTILVR